MAVRSVKRFVAAIFLLSCLVPTISGTCTTVLTAAKAAYDSQIDYMRRGLSAETAVSLYAEFIANLVAKAWDTGPMGAAFGDVCISDTFIDQLQDANGSILASSAIDDKIVQENAEVALMTKEDLEGLSYAAGAADSEWALTSSYLMEGIPLMINVSRLVFPSEGAIRVDPYQSDACYQFEERYSTTGLSTLSADNWTANVLSLVLNLIDMGANATKSLQLLKHTVAYTTVGTRCYGVQGSELQVPMVFLTAYARQSAWLALNNNEPIQRKDLTASSLLYAKPEMVRLLSSFSSGGRFPETVVTANGNLRDLNFGWTSSTDADETSNVLKEILPEPEDQARRVESAVNSAISAFIANKNDLSFSISRTVKVSKPFWPISGLGIRWGEATESIKSATRRLLGIPDEEATIVSLDLPTTVRQQCGANWLFFLRPYTFWTEQCCGPICITAVEGFPPLIAALFTEACCDPCNEYNACTGGEVAAAEGAAEIVGIELPPGYGDNESIPLMI